MLAQAQHGAKAWSGPRSAQKALAGDIVGTCRWHREGWQALALRRYSAGILEDWVNLQHFRSKINDFEWNSDIFDRKSLILTEIVIFSIENLWFWVKRQYFRLKINDFECNSNIFDRKSMILSAISIFSIENHWFWVQQQHLQLVFWWYCYRYWVLPQGVEVS